jgi:hypothetical protein
MISKVYEIVCDYCSEHEYVPAASAKEAEKSYSQFRLRQDQFPGQRPIVGEVDGVKRHFCTQNHYGKFMSGDRG